LELIYINIDYSNNYNKEFSLYTTKEEEL